MTLLSLDRIPTHWYFMINLLCRKVETVAKPHRKWGDAYD